MKITNSTKLIIPVYSKFFKGATCFAAVLMAAFSAFLVYISIIEGSQQEGDVFWLTFAIMVSLTFICILSAYTLLRNKIIVDNGRISWGYLVKHAVYIDDIVGITDIRTVTTLHGEQFAILRFSDRKDKTYTMTVNSTQGKDFLNAMIETFGKPD